MIPERIHQHKKKENTDPEIIEGSYVRIEFSFKASFCFVVVETSYHVTDGRGRRKDCSLLSLGL